MAHLEGKRNPNGEGIDCSCLVGLRLAKGPEGLTTLLKAGKGNRVNRKVWANYRKQRWDQDERWGRREGKEKEISWKCRQEAQSCGTLNVQSELYFEGGGDIRRFSSTGVRNKDALEEFNKDEKKLLCFVKCCEIQFQLHHFCTETCHITPGLYICKMGVRIPHSLCHRTAENSKL